MSIVRREKTDLPDAFRRFFDTDWDKPWLRVEEFVEDEALVVRAELPDIDPDKDVELSVVDGVLEIRVPMAQAPVSEAVKIPVQRG